MKKPPVKKPPVKKPEKGSNRGQDKKKLLKEYL